VRAARTGGAAYALPAGLVTVATLAAAEHARKSGVPRR
jgi:hypothetical protein